MGTSCTSYVGERVPWMDMLRRKGSRGDVAVYCADKESATSNGHARKKLDGTSVGQAVRCRSLFFLVMF
jgi:hypothetical protein